jgi:hypothetical protein
MEIYLNHEVNHTYKNSMDTKNEHRTDGDDGDDLEPNIVEASAEVYNAVNRE